LGRDSFLIWGVMITSAAHRPWPGDVPIHDLEAAGLSAPCVVRTAKIANLETTIASHLGWLSSTAMAQVDLELRRIMRLR
jgi:mRNA interferase MazF